MRAHQILAPIVSPPRPLCASAPLRSYSPVPHSEMGRFSVISGSQSGHSGVKKGSLWGQKGVGLGSVFSPTARRQYGVTNDLSITYTAGTPHPNNKYFFYANTL